jgi:hypothetical protein
VTGYAHTPAAETCERARCTALDAVAICQQVLDQLDMPISDTAAHCKSTALVPLSNSKHPGASERVQQLAEKTLDELARACASRRHSCTGRAAAASWDLALLAACMALARAHATVVLLKNRGCMMRSYFPWHTWDTNVVCWLQHLRGLPYATQHLADAFQGACTSWAHGAARSLRWWHIHIGWQKSACRASCCSGSARSCCTT